MAVGAATTALHAAVVELAGTATPLTFETASERAAMNSPRAGTPPPPPMRAVSLAVEATPSSEAAQKLHRSVSWYATEPCDSRRSYADIPRLDGSSTTRPSLSDREDGAGLGAVGTRAQGDGDGDAAVFESLVGDIAALSVESVMDPPPLGSTATATLGRVTAESGRPAEQARDARSGRPTADAERTLAKVAAVSEGKPETTRATYCSACERRSEGGWSGLHCEHARSVPGMPERMMMWGCHQGKGGDFIKSSLRKRHSMPPHLGDWLALPLGLVVGDVVCVVVILSVGLWLGDAACVLVLEGVRVVLDVGLLDRERLGVGPLEGVGVAEALQLGVPLALWLADADELGLELRVRDVLGAWLRDGDGVVVAVGDTEGVRLRAWVALLVSLCVGEPVIVADWVAVRVGVRVMLGVRVGVGTWLTVIEAPWLPDCVSVADSDDEDEGS